MFTVKIAIDLLDGKVVRLFKGIKDNCKIYSKQPQEILEECFLEGINDIHIVNLSGAFKDKSSQLNFNMIKSLDKKNNHIEVGGGIKTFERVKDLLESGVENVILSSMPITNKKEFLKIINNFKDKITISIDEKDGYIMTNGWTQNSNIKTEDFIDSMLNLGITNFIYTNIKHDGVLQGINVKRMLELFKTKEIRQKVVIAGGITSKNDLSLIKENYFKGVIIGKSFYENLISFQDIRDVINCKKYDDLFQKLSLVPTIIQDIDTKEVVMLAYMNKDSFNLTLRDNLVWFYSRSRQELWLKGRHSGNRLQVKNIQYDCDKDAILIKVKLLGKKIVCHTGNYSCFYRKINNKKEDN